MIQNSMRILGLSRDEDKESGGNREDDEQKEQRKNSTDLAIFCSVAVLDSICSCVLTS